MAKTRVQTPAATYNAAQLRAFAKPVETYVRPAQEQTPLNALSQFAAAISPAIKAEADKKKEQELKLLREKEKGIAAKRTTDATLGLNKAVREANAHFLNNQQWYKTATEEEVANKRAEIMQPYINMAQESGDELLYTAVQNSVKESNAAWIANVYDKFIFTETQKDDFQALGEELIAISEMELTQIDGFDTPEQSMNWKIGEIDKTINNFQKGTGYLFNDINDHVFNNIIAPRVKEHGREALYNWGQRRELYNIDRHQTTVKTINSELALRDKNMLKAKDSANYQMAVTRGVDAFLAGIGTGGANVALLGEGQEIVLESGTKFTIQQDDIINAFEKRAGELGMSDALRMDFYRRTGYIPTYEKSLINSGKSFFYSGNLENEGDLAQASAAFQAIYTLRNQNVGIPTSVLNADDEKRYKIVEMWHKTMGMSLKEALVISQSRLDFSVKPSNKLRASVEKAVGTMFITDHAETSNNFKNITEISEDVELLMQSGITDEKKAIQMAVDAFNKDHVIHTASNGVKFTFKQLNTDPNISVDVQSTLNSAAQAISENEQMMNIVSQLYPLAEDAGFVIINDANDTDVLRLQVIDGTGQFHGQLGTISKSQLFSDPSVVNNIIARNIEEAKQQGINVDSKPVGSSSIADIDSDFISPDDLMLAQSPEATTTKEQFAEDMGSVMGVIAEPLQAAGQTLRDIFQSTAPELDIPQTITDTVDRVASSLVQATGDIGTFFQEEYDNTKKKFSNLKAISRANEILADVDEELSTELGLDVRGLFTPSGLSERGITQKQQAAIARTIIAVQESNEKLYNIETADDLSSALATAASEKNVSPQAVLEQIIEPIAYHESGGQPDNGNIKQGGNGIARGVMQFEPERFKTSVQRTFNLFERINQPVPEWVSNIDVSGDTNAIQKQITLLSANQQKALAVYDLLQKGEADIAKVINGEVGLTEFWLDHWWSGSAKDRYKRSRSFNKSVANFRKQS